MYDHITNSCIKIGESTDSLTWEDSREECQKDGGDLISITSYEKMDFIMNNIKCKNFLANYQLFYSAVHLVQFI